MYHGFTDLDYHDRANSFLNLTEGKHLQIKKFRAQLLYLKRRYNIISLHHFVECCKNHKKLPKNSLIITIDDGYLSNYKLAYPLLNRLNIPATIFVTTDFIQQQKFLWTDRIEYAFNRVKTDKYQLKTKIQDKTKAISKTQDIFMNLSSEAQKIAWARKVKQMIKARPQEQRLSVVEELESLLKNKLILNSETPQIYLPLSWEQIREMRNSKIISIGSHTHTHPILTQCTPSVIKQEINLSKKLIEQNTRAKIDLFCYPNGTSRDFNDYTKEVLKDNDYYCATTIEGFNDQHSDLFALKRIWVSQEMSRIEFIMDLAGLKTWIKNILSKIIY